MKFQNPSLNSVLNGRKDERTNGQAESNMLPTFQSWGHKNGAKVAHCISACYCCSENSLLC